VLTNLLLLIIEAVSGFFVILLLMRFYMQWLRVSFRNQLGQFVVAVTDWLVKPARRIVPSLFGLDMPSLIAALVLHSSFLTIAFWLKGFSFGAHASVAIPVVLAIAVIELLRYSVYLLTVIILMAAVLSWVNPHAPLAPLFNNLSRPFLKPVRRVIPPIANVDLSPLILLLGLQIALMLIASLRARLIPFIA
jgi:YggT family protein